MEQHVPPNLFETLWPLSLLATYIVRILELEGKRGLGSSKNFMFPTMVFVERVDLREIY